MDIKELVRTGMFSVGCLMCHTKKSRVVYYHDVHVGDSWTTMSTPFELFKLHISAIRKSGFEIVRDINNPKGDTNRFRRWIPWVVGLCGLVGFPENISYNIHPYFIDWKRRVSV